jgi:threonine dehydratase
MYAAVKTGSMQGVIAKPTIADGVEGAIEADAITLALCRACVDDFILVSEEEIEAALELVIARHFMLVEGAGALAVAAFIKEKERFKDKNVVLVISGGKIGLETLKFVLGRSTRLQR